jgi:acyl-CoA dehydrogenase
MIPVATRFAYSEEHESFRDQVRRFLEREVTPNLERWDRAAH